MIKNLLIAAFSCLTPFFVCGQQFALNEIVKIDTEKGIDIKYPIFTYKNPDVSAKVNQKIKYVFYEYSSVDAREKIENAIDSAINIAMTDFYADVPFRNNDILCVQLHYEAMVAYPSSWTEYYNFSGYGNILTIDSLIAPSKMIIFKSLLEKKQAVNIKNAIANFKDFKSFLDAVSGNCMDHYDPSKFFITDTGLTVIIDCDFPHVIQSMNPNTYVFFSITELKGIFTRDKYFSLNKPRH